MTPSQDWNPQPVNRKSVALPIVQPRQAHYNSPYGTDIQTGSKWAASGAMGTLEQPYWSNPTIFNFLHSGTLALTAERQSARMSEIKNVG